MRRLTAYLRPAIIMAIFFPFESAHPQWSTDPTANNPICTAINSQQYPAMVSDGSGGAIIAWEDARGAYLELYAQRIGSSGKVQWTSDGERVCTATSFQYAPAIASDDSGGAIITWYDSRNGNFDIYAQKISSSGVTQWTPDGVAICTATGDQKESTIMSDGLGGAIIAWWDYRNYDYNIYAQRIDASGTVRWAANGIVVCNASGVQRYPVLATDGSGGAIITWHDARAGIGDLDVYAQRIDSSGAAKWTANGIAICSLTGYQQEPSIIDDDSGGAFIVWCDSRNGNFDIYVQRIDSAGAPQWDINGKVICSATGNQNRPKIVKDGSRGIIVAWDDERNVNNDIFAQRIDRSGAVRWMADGIPVCTATSNQLYCRLVSDGSGGAILTWDDLRNINDDVFAAGIDSSGNLRWTTDGVAICTSGQNQLSPVIVGNGSGGAIIAWYDHRNASDYDIYAQQVDADGNLGSDYSLAVSVVSLSATSDNRAVTLHWRTGGEVDNAGFIVSRMKEGDPDFRKIAGYESDESLLGLGTSPQGREYTYTDKSALAVGRYTYRLESVSSRGAIRVCGDLTVEVALPKEVSLCQNYPNPFNPTTEITYRVAKVGNVTLKVYDLLGRNIATLVDGKQNPGGYTVKFDASRFPSGVYFYRLQAGGRSMTKKLVLMK